MAWSGWKLETPWAVRSSRRWWSSFRSSRIVSPRQGGGHPVSVHGGGNGLSAEGRPGRGPGLGPHGRPGPRPGHGRCGGSAGGGACRLPRNSWSTARRMRCSFARTLTARITKCSRWSRTSSDRRSAPVSARRSLDSSRNKGGRAPWRTTRTWSGHWNGNWDDRLLVRPGLRATLCRRPGPPQHLETGGSRKGECHVESRARTSPWRGKGATPTQILMAEHELILQALEALGKRLDRYGGPPDAGGSGLTPRRPLNS